MPSTKLNANPGAAVVAALEHMTGPARGETDWIVEGEAEIRLGADRRLRFSSDGADERAGALVARMRRQDGGYLLEPASGEPIWVNGAALPAGWRPLAHGDVIEFCERGPISRVSLYRQGGRPPHTLADMVRDFSTYLRVSRQPLPARLWRASAGLIRRLALETSFVFRAVVILALAVLIAFVYRGERERSRLEHELASGAARLESFSAALARAREEALTPADLNAVSRDLAARLGSAAGRLEALEERGKASRTVIARSLASVAFLQGAYGYREAASGRFLRHMIDGEGRKLLSPVGQPLLTLEGDGPVAERQYTGTGFAVADPAAVVTNRHVALPWEKDASIEMMAAQGLEPVMLRLIAYFPGEPRARAMRLVRAGDESDLAVLAFQDADGTGAPLGAPGLRLAGAPPAPGSEVIVLGYPTGLRALLAQTGPAFVRKLQADNALDFWGVAARLAEAGYIAPLASRGIVGQATLATIVYDAETTHGGSGGPVLNAAGEVVAVNMAILPEYGGSNLGVPAALLTALLGEGPSN